jgi:hypothetical protein
VVAEGLTDVDPLAKVEVNVPGVMAMPVAPEVDQVSVLLEPGLMLVGLAVNELITGSAAAETTTCAEAVTEPAALVAVSTYVVVSSGLTPVEPLAEEGVMFPGLMVRLAAPDVVQLSVLVPPNVMPVGLAVNELIAGRLGWVTVTVAVAVVVPVLLVAVMV